MSPLAVKVVAERRGDMGRLGAAEGSRSQRRQLLRTQASRAVRGGGAHACACGPRGACAVA